MGYPIRRSVSYTCERVIHMVDSFHSTRLTRLNLAHQRAAEKNKDLNREG